MHASEDLHTELSGSPLWNRDLSPTPPSRRTWSTYNIAALWIGMAVVITTYTLASGLMQQGMNWYQAIRQVYAETDLTSLTDWNSLTGKYEYDTSVLYLKGIPKPSKAWLWSVLGP